MMLLAADVERLAVHLYQDDIKAEEWEDVPVWRDLDVEWREYYRKVAVSLFAEYEQMDFSEYDVSIE